jgi:hypothetical protein
MISIVVSLKEGSSEKEIGHMFNSLSGFWRISDITAEPKISEKITGNTNTTKTFLVAILF